ncbi:hypothetical protein AWC31_25855 [Mycolicibacterium wolinskyi]|uniref:Uncharacterized protein n=1 Tax=Mycolicibacterium wolinskyi TaxID=59750 RepID=A0A1X2F841_9MYCO|nr:hypothetical protein AWC31_25855 [Mycolicibacterium wolinskyi]
MKVGGYDYSIKGTLGTQGVQLNASAEAYAVKTHKDLYAPPNSNLKVDTNGMVGVKGQVTIDHAGGGADVFAGAAQEFNLKYENDVLKYSGTAEVQAGAGAASEWNLGFEGGKLLIKGKYGRTWGLGGKVSQTMAIDPDAVEKHVFTPEVERTVDTVGNVIRITTSVLADAARSKFDQVFGQGAATNAVDVASGTLKGAVSNAGSSFMRSVGLSP